MAASNSDRSKNRFPSNIGLTFDGPFDDVQIICLDIDMDDIRYWKKKSDYFLGVSFIDDIDSCLRDIQYNWMDRIFLIVSDQFASDILPKVERIPNVISVFIFCKNPNWKNTTITLYSKSCGVFYDQDDLLMELKDEIFRKSSFFPTKNVFQDERKRHKLFPKKNKIRQKLFLDPTDMQLSSLLIDINNAARPLHHDDRMLCDKQQMYRECRFLFHNEPKQLEEVDDFFKTYERTESIKSYTQSTFLFNLINKVIRTQSNEIIRKFRFFIKDFEEMLDLLFAKQIFDQWSSSSQLPQKLLILYRGQKLPYEEFSKLESSVGRNIIISQYLSTTTNIELAKRYTGAEVVVSQEESVLYFIDMSIIYRNYVDKPDPSIYYYSIKHISQFTEEEEILLRIGTTFKVIDVKYIPCDRLWHVKLRLEAVDDYRSKNNINRTPVEIVQSFFYKASQKQKINVMDIINKNLSLDIITKMSIYIRLGHLVKHHPQEQLYYYQFALSLIPSNQPTLLQLGYWAIRIRCIFSVNDLRLVPVDIYRQTVLHIQGNLQRKLHHELARIDQARADFSSAKLHYEFLKNTLGDFDHRLSPDEIERLQNETNQLNSKLQSSEVAYRYLYAGILTTGERAIIEYQCKKFQQSIDTLSLSKNFSFADILPDVDLKQHYQLVQTFFNNIILDPTDLSIKHLFIISLVNKPFTIIIEDNLTIGQLKTKIRSNLEIPHPEGYDFRLIHLGITLSDEQKLITAYHINDQSFIYLIHGPNIKNQPANRLDQESQENTGLTAADIKHISLVGESQLKKLQTQSQKHAFNSLFLSENKDRNSQTIIGKFDQYFQQNLNFSQYDEDNDDADPADLLGMSDSLVDQYFRNSGPQTSASELMDLISRHPYQLNTGENNNNQQTSSNDLQHQEEQINEILSKCTTS